MGTFFIQFVMFTSTLVHSALHNQTKTWSKDNSVKYFHNKIAINIYLRKEIPHRLKFCRLPLLILNFSYKYFGSWVRKWEQLLWYVVLNKYPVNKKKLYTKKVIESSLIHLFDRNQEGFPISSFSSLSFRLFDSNKDKWMDSNQEYNSGWFRWDKQKVLRGVILR